MYLGLALGTGSLLKDFWPYVSLRYDGGPSLGLFYQAGRGDYYLTGLHVYYTLKYSFKGTTFKLGLGSSYINYSWKNVRRGGLSLTTLLGIGIKGVDLWGRVNLDKGGYLSWIGVSAKLF